MFSCKCIVLDFKIDVEIYVKKYLEDILTLNFTI